MYLYFLKKTATFFKLRAHLLLSNTHFRENFLENMFVIIFAKTKILLKSAKIACHQIFLHVLHVADKFCIFSKKLEEKSTSLNFCEIFWVKRETLPLHIL
jgi:hypothetical protein